jgi:hypothetical protein
MLPLLACGIGVYLGLYFNILVLVPFSLLSAGAYVASSCASGQNLLESLGFVLFPIISLQAGYMLGLTGRETFGQLRSRLNIGLSKRI